MHDLHRGVLETFVEAQARASSASEIEAALVAGGFYIEHDNLASIAWKRENRRFASDAVKQKERARVRAWYAQKKSDPVWLAARKRKKNLSRMRARIRALSS